MKIVDIMFVLWIICWILVFIFAIKDEVYYGLICIFVAIILTFIIEMNDDEKTSKNETIYKAELKSGEIVEATDCSTKEDKSFCFIKDKEYVVVSYEKISTGEGE